MVDWKMGKRWTNLLFQEEDYNISERVKKNNFCYLFVMLYPSKSRILADATVKHRSDFISGDS